MDEAHRQSSTDELPETSVATSIMLRVPTSNLSSLRQAFDSEKLGLDLKMFLSAFIKNMDLETEEELHLMVPNLIDFFNFVDINGDGRMEWSEFVMFIIEQVIKDESLIYERFASVSRRAIQEAAAHNTVRCCKFIQELNKVIVGVGDKLHVYDADDGSPSWMTDGIKLKLKKKETRYLGDKSAATMTIRERVDPRLNNTLEILDIAFIGSVDILCILRSDLCVEFLKFTSRSKVHPDFIIGFGILNLPQNASKIAIRDIEKEPLRLFAISTSNVVDSWALKVGSIGPVEMKDPKQLSKHSDYIRDIMVIHCESYSLLVTGGMDKCVHIW